VVAGLVPELEGWLGAESELELAEELAVELAEELALELVLELVLELAEELAAELALALGLHHHHLTQGSELCHRLQCRLTSFCLSLPRSGLSQFAQRTCSSRWRQAAIYYLCCLTFSTQTAHPQEHQENP